MEIFGEIALVCFNSITKTIINSDEYDLDKSFKEVLYMIGYWINEESGRVIESIDTEYVNIFIYSPLPGSEFNELSFRLKNSRKGLINIKSSDNK